MNDSFEIFYINLNSSQDRNDAIQKHLNTFPYPYHRIDAVTVGDNHDVNLTRAMHPCNDSTDPITFNTTFLQFNQIRINRLCIAPRNVIKEIAVTLSHLKAVLTAILSNNTNPYAMIMEDDMALGFDIDFKSLIDIFPTDFGAIQLFVINKDAVAGLLRKYLKNNSYVNWKPTFYSAGGYIINKVEMRAQLHSLFNQEGPIMELDLLAGSDRLVPLFLRTEKAERNCTWDLIGSGDNATRVRTCVTLNEEALNNRIGLPKKDGSHHACYPAQCCDEKRFITRYPCVLSKDVAADYYIYNLVPQKTFTTTVPLLKGGSLSYNSTINSNHTTFGWRSLRKVERVINSMYTGTIKPPFYVTLRQDVQEALLEEEKKKKNQRSRVRNRMLESN